MNPSQVRRLLDPMELEVCLLCGERKIWGYQVCRDCRGTCPMVDCRGVGRKRGDYEQCVACNRYLVGLGMDWRGYLYVRADGALGMASVDVADDGQGTLWRTPVELELNPFQAARGLWVLRGLLYHGQRGDRYLAQRLQALTGLSLGARSDAGALASRAR